MNMVKQAATESDGMVSSYATVELVQPILVMIGW
jgi:hypothetical protein